MSGKVALITGGVGGIGTAICQRLAKDGFRIVATYIAMEADGIPAWTDAQKALGMDVTTVELDVTDFAACEKTFAEVEGKVGPIEVLVNCAGITRDGTFKKMSLDNWKAVLSTNLDSVFNTTRQVINGMLERKSGRIINISSINGRKGQFGQANYATAKAGMHGFTMSLAQETARKGITVNTISPGYIGTSMVMAIPEEVRNQIIAQIPIGRLGKPEEIGALIAYLASDDAAFVTGANIDINGGQFMG